jgi:glutamine synthetase
LDHDERARRDAQAQVLEGELARRGVDVVALTWVDTSGITRMKAVPTARLRHAAAWGVGASPVFDTFLVDDSAVQGAFSGGPVGDLRLHPDLSRLTVLAAQPGWAWAPADRYTQDGDPHPMDARLLTRAANDRLAAAGLRLSCTFEVEWCVSEGDGDEFTEACSGPAYGMARLGGLSDYVREIVRALVAQDVGIVQIHPEYAAGQFELSVAPGDPVAAADTYILVRETIRAVTANGGRRATFAPKVLADGVGNGPHLHFSLWQGERNLMANPDPESAQIDATPYAASAAVALDPAGEAFTAGILEHLPGLLAISAPSVASYLRLIPSHWASAFACWGVENREAALRLIAGSRGERDRAANMELKCVDGAANPYLLLAAVIAAGLDGIAAKSSLPEPVSVDPVSLPEAERAARGIARLPTSLAAATAAFEADPLWRTVFGAAFVDTVATVRRGETALFQDVDPAEICARTRWRY